MCTAHVCTSLSQKSETHWVKPCANTLKNRWWNHSILEISVWSVFDLTQIRLLRITLIPDQNGRSLCKINQDAEKAKRMMITAPWAMEWIMLYFQFICSSWLTDLFGVLKSNLTKVTKWDPHDFYFATRSLFLFKFFPGRGGLSCSLTQATHPVSDQESGHCVPPKCQLETSNQGVHWANDLPFLSWCRMN